MLWCGIALLLAPGIGGNDEDVFVPIFQWKEQKLYYCEKYRQNSLECECFLYNPSVRFPPPDTPPPPHLQG